MAKANQSRFLALFRRAYDACTVRRCVVRVDQTLMGLAGMEAFYRKEGKIQLYGFDKDNIALLFEYIKDM